jgi:hypothetical protein
MSYPTGQPFSVLFEPKRFDLVYGLGTERGSYFYRLPDAKRRAALKEAFVMIDNYNNTLGLFKGYTFANAADAERFGNVVKDRVNLQFPVGHTGPAGQRKAQELNRYARALLDSPHSPGVVASRSDARLAREGFPDRQQNIQWKVTRASCKFGIEYVVKHSPPNRRIHFVLDGIGDHDIIRKARLTGHAGQKAVPITTSELRAVYRHWNVYREKVWFYRNFMCVLPPWETNREWDKYALYRVHKYMKKLRAAMQAKPDRAEALEHEITGYVEAAERFQEEGRYAGAVGLLKHAASLLTGGAPPAEDEGVAADVGASGKPLSAHVRGVLDAYDAQAGPFRRKSQKSRDASARLRQLLGSHVDLARAVRHYLDLDTTAGARVGGGVTARLDRSSTLHDMLMRTYRAWLGVENSIFDKFF